MGKLGFCQSQKMKNPGQPRTKVTLKIWAKRVKTLNNLAQSQLFPNIKQGDENIWKTQLQRKWQPFNEETFLISFIKLCGGGPWKAKAVLSPRQFNVIVLTIKRLRSSCKDREDSSLDNLEGV